MGCWWEPISHTAEDRTRHLHRESLDGEAGELMVPSYKYRFEVISSQPLCAARRHQSVLNIGPGLNVPGSVAAKDKSEAPTLPKD